MTYHRPNAALLAAIAVALVLLSTLMMTAALISSVQTSKRIDRVVRSNCLNVEELKSGQREAARATIAGDRAFLMRNPNGTKDFPREVVLQDIADKQRTIRRFAPRAC